MYNQLEIKYLQLMSEDAQGPVSKILKFCTVPLSWVYGFFVSARNLAYDAGLLKVHWPVGPVTVSVGNIEMGGTGKTPLTILLAKEFVKECSVSVLTRGYRSQVEYAKAPLILSEGDGPQYLANYCGDEPYLLSDNLHNVSIFVGKNRKHSAEMAASRGAQLIILDDGMQHRQLGRHFDVVIVDANSPAKQKRLFPRGLFREKLTALKRAHLVVLNNIESGMQFNALSAEIAKYTVAPIMGTRIAMLKIETFEGKNIETLSGKKIGVFCGIAKPENFVATLAGLNATIVDKFFIKDHGTFKERELKNFIDHCKAKGAEYILCTEKDKVKLNKTLQTSLPLAWIKIELEIKEGIAHWKEFVKKTIDLVNSQSVLGLKG